MYMVILKGPGIDEDGKFGNQADFGWEITLNGRCAAGLVPNNEGLTAIERGLCECDKGMEPNPGGGDGPCSPCATGYVKTNVGNEPCITCQALTWQLSVAGVLSMFLVEGRLKAPAAAAAVALDADGRQEDVLRGRRPPAGLRVGERRVGPQVDESGRRAADDRQGGLGRGRPERAALRDQHETS